MSISMKDFIHPATPAPHLINPEEMVKERAPFQLLCHACGYEPDDFVTPPARCPRCMGSAWERFTRPRSLLVQAETRSAREEREAAANAKARARKTPAGRAN